MQRERRWDLADSDARDAAVVCLERADVEARLHIPEFEPSLHISAGTNDQFFVGADRRGKGWSEDLYDFLAGRGIPQLYVSSVYIVRVWFCQRQVTPAHDTLAIAQTTVLPSELKETMEANHERLMSR